MSPAKTTDPVKMLFGGRLLWAPESYHVLDGDQHWRHLINTTERSEHGSDAALCQFTLTTCSLVA